VDLVVEHLTKRFGERVAVDIESLSIRDGEFFTFVGPSGCGKSTLLNVIAGLEEPTGGTVRIGDRILNPLPPHRRNVAFVFQSYALYPHRTAFRNIAFPLEIAGVRRDEIRRRVDEVAAVLGLGRLLDKYPRQLSGGERQRVALGRAIVRKPDFFLFDEPLSNLDAPLRAEMRRELKRLHAQLGRTFVYVTHDQEEALSLSDRIAVMQDGRIEQCGPPEEIYAQPLTTFVAGFFGMPPINLLSVPLVCDEEGTSATVAEVRIPIRSGPVDSGHHITLGVRPEDVSVEREVVPGRAHAVVTAVELHGGQCHVECRVGEHSLVGLVPPGAAPTVGERVSLRLAAARVHVFDHAGRRIDDHR